MKQDATTAWIVESLRANNQKITGPREQIAVCIASHKEVFSPNEIIAELPNMDRVTVYRVLELFESLDIIHPVLTHHGEKHYELHGDAHHHHVVCTGCEKASCIDCDISRTKIKGFTNIHHSVVFTGLCSTCA